MEDSEELSKRDSIMTHEKAQLEGLVGILWELGGRHLHESGQRYRRSTDNESVAFWLPEDMIKNDIKRLADSNNIQTRRNSIGGQVNDNGK